MKPKLLLRIASIVMLLHDVGHTFGHLSWKENTGPAKREVIRQMTENRFPFMGAVKSLGDYYAGYGFAASLALLAWGIDELVFFFPFAAAFSLLAMVLTVLALVQLKPQAE